MGSKRKKYKQSLFIKDSLTQKTQKSKLERKYSWRMDIKDLDFTKLLGNGASGEVYKGYYRNEPVAIKVLKTTNESDIEEFIKEFTIFVSVTSPYIVSFIGALLDPRLCIVMEFCEKGSLYRALNQDNFPLDWNTSLSFAKEITLGIHALHTHNPVVIHRDIKTLNVLVTKDYHCKLADFGLSRTDTTTNLNSLMQCKGTYAYIAPEAYTGEKATTYTDIYSLGIIIWEIFTRLVKKKYERPYGEFKIRVEFTILVQVAQEGLRPTLPNQFNDKLKQIIQKCWSQKKEDRPTTDQILIDIEALIQEYNQNKNAWDSLVQ